MLQNQIIKKVDSGTIYASLGNFSWAALMIPLAVEPDGSATISFFPHTTSHVEWVHVTEPDNWQMIPWTPHATSGNKLALLHSSNGPVPIVKACLLDPFIYKLVHDDYLRLAKHYNIMQFNKDSNDIWRHQPLPGGARDVIAFIFHRKL